MQGDQQEKREMGRSRGMDPNFTSDERIAYERIANKGMKKQLPRDAAREEEQANRTKAFRTSLREGYDPMVGVETDKPPRGVGVAPACSASGKHPRLSAHKGAAGRRKSAAGPFGFAPLDASWENGTPLHHKGNKGGALTIPGARAEGGFPFAILASLLPAAIPLISKGVEWIVNKIRGKGALSVPGGRKILDSIMRKRFKKIPKKYAGAGMKIKTGSDFWAQLAEIVHREICETVPEILDMKHPELVDKMASDAVHKMLPKSFLSHIKEEDYPLRTDEDGEDVPEGEGLLDGIFGILGKLFGMGPIGGEGEEPHTDATADFLFPVVDWMHRKMLKDTGDETSGEGAFTPADLREQFHEFMSAEGEDILSGEGPFWDRVKLISKKFLNNALPALTSATKHIAKPVLTAILNKFGVKTDGNAAQFLLDLLPGLIPEVKSETIKGRELDLVDAKTAEEKEKEAERKKRKDDREEKEKARKDKKGKGRAYEPRSIHPYESYDLSDDIAASGRKTRTTRRTRVPLASGETRILYDINPRAGSERKKKPAPPKRLMGRGEGYLWT